MLKWWASLEQEQGINSVKVFFYKVFSDAGESSIFTVWKPAPDVTIWKESIIRHVMSDTLVIPVTRYPK